MPDRFLGSPIYTRQNTLNTARETRILRDRQAAHEDAFDRAAATSSEFSSARMLVQVFNGGSMPSAVPRVYFTHPVIATGSESEGATPSFSADTVTTVPVIFLNGMPAVGDYATAYAVGGRWVSEETPPIHGSSPANCWSTPCNPCPIPNVDLSMTITGTVIQIGHCDVIEFDPPGGCTTYTCSETSIAFSQTLSMTQDPGGLRWVSDCVALAGANPCVWYRFVLTCTGGYTLGLNAYGTADCSGPITGTCLLTGSGGLSCGGGVPVISLASSSCSPNFSLVYNNVGFAPGGFCGCFTSTFAPPCDIFQTNFCDGFVLSTITITGPNPGTHCFICFVVFGCCGALSGAEVSVSGGPSGYTNSNGTVYLDVGSAGPYTVTVTATGYNSLTQTVTLTCNQPQDFTLSIADGYVCCCACPSEPLPDTLTVSEPKFFAGGLTAAYSANLVGDYPDFAPVGAGNGFPSTGGWVASGECTPQNPAGDPITYYFLLQCTNFGHAGQFTASLWLPAPDGPGGGPLRVCLAGPSSTAQTCEPLPFSVTASCADFAPCNQTNPFSTVTWTL